MGLIASRAFIAQRDFIPSRCVLAESMVRIAVK